MVRRLGPETVNDADFHFVTFHRSERTVFFKGGFDGDVEQHLGSPCPFAYDVVAFEIGQLNVGNLYGEADTARLDFDGVYHGGLR